MLYKGQEIETDEQLDAALADLDDIATRPIDQLYAESVAELGRGVGITDKMDRAARIPQAKIDAAMAKTAAPAAPAATPAATPAASPAPAAPVEQKLDAQKFIDAHAVNYETGIKMGGKNIDPNFTNNPTWDEAVRNQQMEKARASREAQRQRLDWMRASDEQRKRQRAEHSAILPQLIGDSLTRLNDSDAGEITTINGRKMRAIKTMSAQGKKNEDGTPSDPNNLIDIANKKYAAMGKNSRIKGVAVGIPLNEADNTPLKDKDGNDVEPEAFAIVVGEDGKTERAVPISLGRAWDQYASAQKVLQGWDDQTAWNDAMTTFGGRNPLNKPIDVTEREQFEAKQAANNAATARDMLRIVSTTGGKGSAAGAKGGAGAPRGVDVGQVLKTVEAMQKFVAENAVNMDENTRAKYDTAINNAMDAIVGLFTPQQSGGGGGGAAQGTPKVEGDMMTLSDGRQIRKDQEFTVSMPDGTSQTYIWRGGAAENVEEVTR